MSATSATAVANEVPPVTRPSRLLSLDLLRGLTLAFMILVNNNGDEAVAYWPLKHAYWNGFTPTDLVFPTFLFLVGVSSVLSISSRLARGVTKAELFSHVLRRTVILYLLGLLVNSFPFFHLQTMRFYGVLPRIALCYLVVSALYLVSPSWRSKAAIGITALIGYWALLRFVPVPGYGVPTHTVPLLDRDGNLTAWLDRQIFPASHLYEGVRDPEGLLSTIPAIGTALIGMLTGIWLQTAHTLRRKAAGIAVAGISGVLLGSLWNITFPINKKMWTSSYVLFAGGLSLLLLALFVWVVDVSNGSDDEARERAKSPLFTPLLVFGTNAISAYVLSELLAGGLSSVFVRPHVSFLTACYRSIAAFIPNPAFASLVYSLCFVAFCWLVIYMLYRRRIFIKI